nr:hypothetical protein CFP56_19420 [Quercus suber]
MRARPLHFASHRGGLLPSQIRHVGTSSRSRERVPSGDRPTSPALDESVSHWPGTAGTLRTTTLLRPEWNEGGKPKGGRAGGGEEAARYNSGGGGGRRTWCPGLRELDGHGGGPIGNARSLLRFGGKTEGEDPDIKKRRT